MAEVQVGDRVQIPGRRVDDPTRTGTVVEIGGSDGAGPHRVRFDDSGAVVLAFPGPDWVITSSGS